MGWDPMGEDPWEPKGIPWEGNPWEPKGIPWEGSRTPHGRGTLPWEGTLGAPSGICFFEVAFLEDPSETKMQNHSHEIRLEKLVCTLLTRYNFAVTRYQNIEKPLTKNQFWPHLGLVIAQNPAEFL